MTEAEIDAGADALRNKLHTTPIYLLRPWGMIENSVKRKWRERAAVVLAAAEKVRAVSPAASK